MKDDQFQKLIKIQEAKKRRKLKDKTKGSQRKTINKKLKERMLNSKRIRWNNSRKLGAEIYMQPMQKCTILATISEGTKETYHQ